MTQAIEPLVPEGVFEPEGRYFDTPTYGLAPRATFDAIVRGAEGWRTGRATMAEYDDAVARSRETFSRIAGVEAADVSIGASVSSLVGPIAAGLDPGSTVLVPEGEFTSLLFPLLVNRGLAVRAVPLGDLPEYVDDSVDVVAFSLVQSSNGAVADSGAIVEAARRTRALLMVDATHAVGWLPFDPLEFDFVFVAAYKWLLCPRGVAFMIINCDREPPALNAGWYAGEDPWESIYGGPLRLSDSARRYDTSPAWLSWLGAVPSLDLIESLGVPAIHDHDVALANTLRVGFGLEPADSAIVTLPLREPDRLSEAGIKASVRASAVRVGCHIHNSSQDVEGLLEALSEVTAE